MEQMKLAHERQLAEEKEKHSISAQEQQLEDAAEKKQRLEAEKQAKLSE